ncbi:LCP family protein [Ruicaihuangia caeni]|uniref:LCP family protein n=1 Tax=Ruicaihuangia caeni TaxID=3042517 RepID=A0AAW6T791_9MICO|nr:LCP family protein [Klugiella sp. YN-L-19]MDI2099389.1 LCP family protein [Klugiella sp. YN-L-19]
MTPHTTHAPPAATPFDGAATFGTPLRQPDTGSPRIMTGRAWWLVVLNLVIPGSAQVLAGNRRLGRFGLGATLLLWTLLVIALVLWFAARAFLLTMATNIIVLWAVQLLALAYAVLWLVLTVDALRLARIVRAAPGARPLIAGFTVLSLLVTVGGAAYLGYLTGVGRDAIASLFGDGHIAEPVDGRYNIMLLGGDAGPDRLGLRPDSISLVSVDAETGASTLIGIPRNLYNAPFSDDSPLWGPFPTGYDCGDDCLISYLYMYGEEHPDLYPDAADRGSTPGVEAMRDAVEGVTGLTVQYAVLIDMQGFAQLVDALGGVTIDVATPLQLGVNGQPAIGVIEAGRQHMDGATALWYARSRYNTTDFDRMERQRQVQEAILAQADPANVLSKFQAVASAGVQVVKTDIPQPMLGRFVELAQKSREQPVTELDLVPPTIDNVMPDFDVAHSLVADAVAPREQEQ